MPGKIKGIYKDFKSITQIFVVKEREMEIGQPTDVIHVAHIGVDHFSTVAPTWMNGSNKTTNSTDSTRLSHHTTLSTRSSQGIDPSMGSQLGTERIRNRSCMELLKVREKRKRGK